MNKICIGCNQEFITNRDSAKFCNQRCYINNEYKIENKGRFLKGNIYFHPKNPWLYTTKNGNSIIMKCRFCDRPAKLKPKCDSTKHEEFYQRSLIQTKIRSSEKRKEVLIRYGGKCSCCGFDDLDKKLHQGGIIKRFLEMDKIDGGHRSMIKEPSYNWLKRNNYPSGWRVLCRPCNSAMEAGENVCEWHKWMLKRDK